jgi:DNA-binding transcriptional MocR family regulator
MNAGTTAERVYDDLKRTLLAGTIGPGERLEPAHLASDLSSSTTPVRDALHRLVGERLVEMRPSIGFHLPIITESSLRDLYAWHEDLATLALRRRVTLARSGLGEASASVDPTEARSIFEAIAQQSDSSELLAQTGAIGDRLAIARVVEREVFDRHDDELAQLWAAVKTSGADARALVVAYHRRRRRSLPLLIKAIYGGRP